VGQPCGDPIGPRDRRGRQDHRRWRRTTGGRAAAGKKGHPTVSELIKHVSLLPEHASGTPGDALERRPVASLVPPGADLPHAAPAVGRSRGPGRLAVAVIIASLVAAVALGAAVFGGASTASGANGGSGSAVSGSSGGPPGAGPAKGSLAASAAGSASASSLAFTVSGTETTSGVASAIVTGRGSFDLTKGVGQLTATVPSLSSLSGSGSQDSLDIVSDGSNLYVNVPALSSLTGGKSWVETSASGLTSLAGSTAGSLPLSFLTDPSQVLGSLGSSGSPVTKVGTVELHGESVTEYRTSISVAQIASKEAQSPTSSSAPGALGKALQDLGVPSLPVTAWVGSDGLLRQLSVSVDLSHASLSGLLGSLASGSAGSSARSSFDLTMGLSHYGEPVSVSVPPASEVTDLNGIGSSLKGMASKLASTLSTVASKV